MLSNSDLLLTNFVILGGLENSRFTITNLLVYLRMKFVERFTLQSPCYGDNKGKAITTMTLVWLLNHCVKFKIKPDTGYQVNLNRIQRCRRQHFPFRTKGCFPLSVHPWSLFNDLTKVKCTL